ncbi:hypothetical protein HG530_003801 [Fusarium avenaceum]|nr:hypothetical protein HG530_003801 [Fusarium avenaceum]
MDATVDVPHRNSCVDRTADKNDRQGDTKGDLCNYERAGERVDDDFQAAESPNGLHIIGGCMHLIHEAELGDGEAVGKEDIANSNEGLRENQAADVAFSKSRKGNGPRQAMRGREEQKLEMLYLRVLDLDLADDPRRVDGDESDADRADDAGHHAQRGEGAGDGQRAEGYGLDDEDDGEALPAETVELCLSVEDLALLKLGDLADHLFAGRVVVILSNGSRENVVLLRPLGLVDRVLVLVLVAVGGADRRSSCGDHFGCCFVN